MLSHTHWVDHVGHLLSALEHLVHLVVELYREQVWVGDYVVTYPLGKETRDYLAAYSLRR